MHLIAILPTRARVPARVLGENPGMKLVNRTAVILWPEQPLVTWIKRKEPGCGLERERDEPTLYLLDTYAEDNLDEVLGDHYERLWRAELRG